MEYESQEKDTALWMELFLLPEKYAYPSLVHPYSIRIGQEKDRKLAQIVAPFA
jgi:hypothetical protein